MEHILWEIGHDLKIENIVRARGCTLYDASGNTYTDLESGVWCTPLGHCHPVVNQALAGQMDAILHTGYCYAHPLIGTTAQALLGIAGMPAGNCLFLTSGSEAVEVGVKAIQLVSGRPKLLTFSDSFLGSLGSSGSKPEEEWYLFDRSACSRCSRPEPCEKECAHFNAIPFSTIAGFVLEPGSASGLVRFPPEKLVTAVTKKIHDTGGFVQVNEITTGMGRTGKWFGFQHYGIRPDIVSVGKGLGNGYPVSAALFNHGISALMKEKGFYHSQSHQNDPLGCAAALAVIQTLETEDLIARSLEKGTWLKQALADLGQKHGQIKAVRGRGLMIALDFGDDVAHPDVIRFHDTLIQKGFIVAKRPNINTFRIDPPLTVGLSVLDAFIRVLDEILTAG